MRYRAFIFVAVFLFVAAAAVQGVASWLEWRWTIRHVLLWVMVGLDVVFVIDFLVSLYTAMVARTGIRYMREGRGWADFLGSVPPLVLHSGPVAFGVAAGEVATLGGAEIAILPQLAAVVGMLRYLRLLRLLPAVRFPRAQMARRHTARVTSTALGATLLLAAAAMIVFPFAGGTQSRLAERMERTAGYIATGGPDAQEQLRRVAAIQPAVIAVEQGDARVFTRFDAAYMDEYFGPNDYGYVSAGNTELFYDRRGVLAKYAAVELAALAGALILVLGLLFGYGRHASRTMTDPIQVMEQGLARRGFDVPVDIPSQYADDDVYRLALLYNRSVLPVKDRYVREDAPGLSSLSEGPASDEEE